MLEKFDRPVFPKRAVITAGMPYGTRPFTSATSAESSSRRYIRPFLRDRIGKENVIFVSGRLLRIAHRRASSEAGGRRELHGRYPGFRQSNHERQREDLAAYHVALDIYAASSFGRASEIHRELCAGFFTLLHENGFLQKLSTRSSTTQVSVFLNGRQVTGQCPIAGCASERGTRRVLPGHQYSPRELLNP